MRYYASISFAALLCGCTIPPRTTVQIVDKSERPIKGFPFRFRLDEGMTQSNFLTPQSQPLQQIDNNTFEGNTDANGEIGISYYFNDRQPSDWRIILLNAETLPSKDLQIIPLRDIPQGTIIKVGIPNP